MLFSCFKITLKFPTEITFSIKNTKNVFDDNSHDGKGLTNILILNFTLDLPYFIRTLLIKYNVLRVQYLVPLQLILKALKNNIVFIFENRET